MTILCGQSDCHAQEHYFPLLSKPFTNIFIIRLLLKIVVEEIPSLSTDAEMPVQVQVTLTKTTTTSQEQQPEFVSFYNFTSIVNITSS